MIEPITLSASLLETFDKCSYIWFSKYVHKFPDESNDGARRGSITHTLLEVLLNPRHDKVLKYTLKNKKLHPSLIRLVKKLAKKEKLGETDSKNQNNFKMIEEMTLVGLNADYRCKGYKICSIEEEFLISNKNPLYKIKGFIDKMAVNDLGDYLVCDYKTSREVKTETELKKNIQALMYSLSVWKQKGKIPTVRFIFLRFPENPIRDVTFTLAELLGFEEYLAYMTSLLSPKNKELATASLAADKPYPKKEDGFSGNLVCGRASYKFQLKKNGEPMYACPFKFENEYYGLFNDKGEIIRSAVHESDLKPKEGQMVLKMQTTPCPRFKKSDFELI